MFFVLLYSQTKAQNTHFWDNIEALDEDGDFKSPIQYRRITNPSEMIALSDTYDIETTPLIYVLDKDKRIIGKKIRAKQIPLVL